MSRTIRPASGITGTISLPGDKSISHRYAMLAALAEGCSELTNYSTGADCASTLACLRSLGVDCSHRGTAVRIEGAGTAGLRAPGAALDAGNSGTTMRLLSGILAGQPFESVIQGDESLSRRPMKRIMTPLRSMGASVGAIDGQYPPLTIRGGRLRPIRYELPVASAQVKSSVLFAALNAPGTTEVVEPVETRNHTEIALRRFGAEVRVNGLEIAVTGSPRMSACDMRIPSDLSSAVFFLAAALMLPGSSLRIERVGLNPTRAAVLEVLQRMGAAIDVDAESEEGGEPVGSFEVLGGGRLAGGEIAGATTAGVIDEIRNRYPTAEIRNDICYATTNRQHAARTIAQRADLVLVVGSRNSSNSMRLREVAEDAGATAYLVDSIEDVDPAWYEGVEVVGLTSGASVPDELLDPIIEDLKARGVTRIEPVIVAEETVEFRLPQELEL